MRVVVTCVNAMEGEMGRSADGLKTQDEYVIEYGICGESLMVY